MKRLVSVCLLVIMAFAIAGCRGSRSGKPPIHLNPNMDWQAKHKAQTLTQTPPAGTVIWGEESSFSNPESREKYIASDSRFYEGRVNGQFVTKIPVPVSKALVERGRERYDIYCVVCHGESGSGQGVVIKRGFVPPPALYADRIVSTTDGYLFDVISNGVRNMPSYGKQIMPEDRWAIVAYVRALQKVRKTHVSELNQSVRSQLK